MSSLPRKRSCFINNLTIHTEKNNFISKENHLLGIYSLNSNLPSYKRSFLFIDIPLPLYSFKVMYKGSDDTSNFIQTILVRVTWVILNIAITCRKSKMSWKRFHGITSLKKACFCQGGCAPILAKLKFDDYSS